VTDSVLLIGIHTRPAVSSAKALGLRTLSVDYFGSVDVVERADVSRSIVSQRPFRSNGRISELYDGGKLLSLAEGLEADITVLTCALPARRRVIGNPPEKLMALKDKELQLRKVGKLGVAVPEHEVVDTREEAVEAAEALGFPCVLKPVRGAGGRGVILLRSQADVPELAGRALVQRYVPGKPVSTSILSTGRDALLLSTSEQILGAGFAGQSGFAYCGNIVPYEPGKSVLAELEELSISIARAFGVIGWNGIDFVVGDEPVFMELNPRFQGTFDCVERSYGINLLDAHIRACQGELIQPPRPLRTAVRLTLYARERCMVMEDLRGMTVDVPVRHSIIERGEPVTTVVTVGGRREDALERCRALARRVYERSLYPLLNLPGVSFNLLLC